MFERFLSRLLVERFGRFVDGLDREQPRVQPRVGRQRHQPDSDDQQPPCRVGDGGIARRPSDSATSPTHGWETISGILPMPSVSVPQKSRGRWRLAISGMDRRRRADDRYVGG